MGAEKSVYFNTLIRLGTQKYRKVTHPQQKSQRILWAPIKF